MGNKRNLTVCFASFMALAIVASTSSAQNPSQAQQAYYQPLTQQQQRVYQATYQQQQRVVPEWMRAPTKVAQPFGPSATPSVNVTGNAPKNFSQPPRTQPPLAQRASDLIQEQQASDQFRQYVAPQTVHPPSLTAPAERIIRQRSQMRPVAFGPKQDDPFGESQAPGGNQQGFDPFADPPKNTQDPFGEGQSSPNQTIPKPFADPPSEPRTEPVLPGSVMQEPGGLDPVLPSDARPVEPVPDSGALEAPRTNGTQDGQLTNPFDDPTPPDREPDYLQATPYHERYIPPAGVYQAPQNQMPPIVQPNQAAPMYHPGYNQPYQQPGYQQPAYQPAYQPIPGQQPAPMYQPQPALVAPNSMALAPAAAPPNDVYSPVVAAPNQCGSCNGACSGGCGLGNSSDCPNFYFSTFGGWSSIRGMESLSGLGEFQVDDGTVFGFALGRRNGRNLRTELEFSYRDNNVTGFLDNSGVLTDLSGDIQSYTGMANSYWEFVNFKNRLFKPYVGGGIGFMSINSEVRGIDDLSILPTGTENDTSLAYQYMAGINYKAYRNVDLFAEYRYTKADTFRLDTNVGTSSRYAFGSDNIIFGMRWKF